MKCEVYFRRFKRVQVNSFRKIVSPVSVGKLVYYSVFRFVMLSYSYYLTIKRLNLKYSTIEHELLYLPATSTYCCCVYSIKIVHLNS